MGVKQLLNRYEAPKEGRTHFSDVKVGDVFTGLWGSTHYVCTTTPRPMNLHIDSWSCGVVEVTLRAIFGGYGVE